MQANRDSKIGYGMSELVQLRRQSSGLLGRSGPDLSGMNADKSRADVMAKSKLAKQEQRGRPATGLDLFVGIRLPEVPLAESRDR